jgi:hypothetical protein
MMIPGELVIEHWRATQRLASDSLRAADTNRAELSNQSPQPAKAAVCAIGIRTAPRNATNTVRPLLLRVGSLYPQAL